MDQLQVVKIQNRDTGLFRNKSGEFNTKGKAYTKLAYAKATVAGLLGNGDYGLAHCDFVIYKADGTYRIPVASYIIEFYTDRGNRGYLNKEEYFKEAEILTKYCRKHNIPYENSPVIDNSNKGIDRCPLCGGNAELINKRTTHKIECTECGCNTGNKHTENEAREIWAMRIK